MRAAATGCSLTGSRRFYKAFAGITLSQFVEETTIRSNDEGLVRQLRGRLQDVTRGANRIRNIDDCGGRLRMHKHTGIGIKRFHVEQRF